MKNILNIIILAILVSSCGNKKEKSKVVLENKLEKTELPKQLFTETEIAKYTVSAIMDQQPEIINVKDNNGIYFVSYTRKDDGKKFDYKIKFNGKNIIWGNSDGRWRDTQYDEKIKYSKKENKLTITQTFEDGSNIDKEFTKSE
tara:strand:- start:30 stop:461 length:432 start_codon:yes stop_codon:yes gene_type:complete